MGMVVVVLLLLVHCCYVVRVGVEGSGRRHREHVASVEVRRGRESVRRGRDVGPTSTALHVGGAELLLLLLLLLL